MEEEEQKEKIEETIKDSYIAQGKNCGEKIAEVIRERGYDTVIPLYRSAVTIETKKGSEEETPYISIKSFNDPHFMGAIEINEETVKEGHEYIIKGERSGIVFYDWFQQRLNGKGKMLTENMMETKKEIEEKREEKRRG